MTFLKSKKWWVLTSVACGTYMATLDASIVNIALPTLTEDLETTLPRIKWVVVTYFLAITCLLLPFGRLSDVYGRKSTFLLGFFIFTIGSALCGLSPTLLVLVIFRILQATGAAMIMANGPAIITATFPATERGSSLGKLSMVVSLGLITGPIIGGWLIASLGWRSIFLVNVPIGLVGMALAYLSVESDDLTARKKRSFDIAGSVLQAGFLMAFILLFEPPGLRFFDLFGLSYAKLWILLFCILSLWLFLNIEGRRKDPVMDLSLLKNQTFWSANLSSFCLFVAYSAFAVLIPYFFERVLHLSTHASGKYMTVIPLAIFLTAPLSGRLSDRYGSRELCFFGAALIALTLFILSGFASIGLSERMETWAIILALSGIGMGMGIFQSPNNNTVMGIVPAAKLSVASALIAMIRNLGLFTGVGLGTSLYAWRSTGTDAESGSLIAALQFAFLAASFFGLASMIFSLGKERGPHWKYGKKQV